MNFDPLGMLNEPFWESEGGLARAVRGKMLSKEKQRSIHGNVFPYFCPRLEVWNPDHLKLNFAMQCPTGVFRRKESETTADLVENYAYYIRILKRGKNSTNIRIFERGSHSSTSSLIF